MELDVGFDHVGARDLATFFQFVTDAKKTFRFVTSAFRGGVFVLCGNVSVVGLRDGNGQSAKSDFGLRFRYRLGRRRSAVICECLEGKTLMYIPLRDIFVSSVIGNEYWVGRTGFWIVYLGRYIRHAV